MKILFKDKSGQFPELQYSEKGRELACLIPDMYDWLQVNYGQGEGQFYFNNCEWGAYYDDNENLVLQLHSEEIDFFVAVNFITGIKEKIEKDYSVQLNLSFI